MIANVRVVAAETRKGDPDPQSGDFDEELAQVDPENVEVVEASSGRSVTRKTHGRTATGAPITDELVEKLTKEAKAGYGFAHSLREAEAELEAGGGVSDSELDERLT